MDKLIKYLDSVFAEDDMTEAWTKYKKFIAVKRGKEQPVSEFIAEFEQEYSKAKACGCEFSDTVLAFSLLEACKLSEIDEKFILTAVDFKTGKEKKDLLAQIKLSLRKFQSRDKVSSNEREKIRVDETLVANLKEALVSEGWKPPGRRRSYSDSDTGGLARNSTNYRGKKNPLGGDGKPVKCFGCQSEYHMLDRYDTKDDSEKAKEKKTKNKHKKGTADKSDKKTAAMLTTLLGNKAQDE